MCRLLRHLTGHLRRDPYAGLMSASTTPSGRARVPTTPDGRIAARATIPTYADGAPYRGVASPGGPGGPAGPGRPPPGRGGPGGRPSPGKRRPTWGRILPGVPLAPPLVIGGPGLFTPPLTPPPAAPGPRDHPFSNFHQ